MTNADKFKNIFGLYATELWSMPEKDFLKWLNSKVVSCSEFPNNSDTINRQAVTKFLNDWLSCLFENCHKQSASDLKMIIKDFKNLPSAQSEPLTDKEQRIFLAAMGREEKVCKHKDSLVRVCHEIERKVKGALWT